MRIAPILKFLILFELTAHLSACGKSVSLRAKPATFPGGESEMGLHCLDQSRPRARFSKAVLGFNALDCSQDSLRGIRISQPPSPLRFSPECDNRVVHITTADYSVNLSVELRPSGKFEAALTLPVRFDFQGEDPDYCRSRFTAKIEGVVDCQAVAHDSTAGVYVRGEWVEAPPMSGCMSSYPCRFRTEAYLGCGL